MCECAPKVLTTNVFSARIASCCIHSKVISLVLRYIFQLTKMAITSKVIEADHFAFLYSLVLLIFGFLI